MKSLIYFGTLLAVVTSASVISPKNENLGINNTLTPLGEVDGKIYYVDFQYMDWHAAVRHCLDLGENFYPATITTRTQMDFIIQAFKERSYSEDIWTAGRDARGPRQYVWDYSGEQVTPVVNFASSPGFQTCLVLRPTPDNGTKVHGVHCEKNRFAVLCEDNCGVDC